MTRQGNPMNAPKTKHNQKARHLQTRAILAGAIMSVSLAPLSGCFEDDTDAAESIEEIREVGVCLTNGIDLIGGKHIEEGTERWAGCFTHDHSFEFTGEVPGTGEVMTVSCPGPSCPLPEPAVGAPARAKFAAGIFASNGYTATQHVMSNVLIEVESDMATLSADFVAYHFKEDLSIDLFNGRWEIEVVQVDGVWLSSHERLTQTNFINVAGTPLGQPQQ